MKDRERQYFSLIKTCGISASYEDAKKAIGILDQLKSDVESATIDEKKEASN